MTGGAAGRWQLIRALGAVADSPETAHRAAPALGLPPVRNAEHRDVFVVNLPAYASVYLGPEGTRGGDEADRVAEFWRMLGLQPPSEPDHLAALLGLYASLGESADAAARPGTAAALHRAHAALYREHLHPWLSAYLDALMALPAPGLARWAQLLRRAVAAEDARQPGIPALPLALRKAPAPVGQGDGLPELARGLTVPVRAGLILTRHRLAQGAAEAGVGRRIGERQFPLPAMLEQDPVATLAWLAAEAGRWQRRHQRPGTADHAALWWAGRAGQTRRALKRAAAAAETARRA
jgi:hypothetical protein